jgi:hypothetical protein
MRKRKFKSWRDYWDFEQAVKWQARYLRSIDSDEFLNTVLETAKKRINTIPAKGRVWRAQDGHSWEPVYVLGEDEPDQIPAPHPAKRMKPEKYRAMEQRANPKGIPYLYVSTNSDTAVAEVRPWVGSLVSVWRFTVRRKLRIVNCTLHKTDNSIYVGREPSAAVREERVWSEIDKAFARPITRMDDIPDYVPTQVIAELFKMHNYDGIAYASSLGPGHNIALFDLDAADPVEPQLYEVKDVKFTVEKR